MLRNHEQFGRGAGREVRRDDGAGHGGRPGRTLSRRLQGSGALAALVGLAIASLAACGVESKDRARTDGGATSGSEVGVASAARPTSGGSGGSGTARLVSDTRPVSAPVGEPVDSSSPANVSYGDAEGVFRRGEYGQAADLFQAYTLRRPENPWGHYMLGISAWRAGDHPRAEAALRRTIEVDSTHAKGLLNLARVLLEQRKASDALEYVEQVVELKPESGEVWRVLGNVRAELGMVDDAVEAYRKALALDHRDSWTMNNLGLLMIREGRYDEALPPLSRATELRPDVAVFQNNLGIALERSGHHAEAVEAFRAALVANAGYEKARISLERIESRTPIPTAAPLDLPGLARLFEDEVSRWKEQSLGVEETGSQEEAGVTGHGG